MYDRIWTVRSEDLENGVYLNTTENVTANIYNQPKGVLSTAMSIINPRNPLQNLINTDTNIEHHVYLHVAEIEKLQINVIRQFNIYHNGSFVYGPITPKYLTADTHFFILPPFKFKSFRFTFRKSLISNLPPIVNGIEIYAPVKMSQLETHLEDGKW